MPYITDAAKRLLETMPPHVAGDLNYKLTLVVIDFLATKGLSYQTCNDIVGALDNCKDEFRRRVQHPYEDKKCAENAENGDVY